MAEERYSASCCCLVTPKLSTNMTYILLDLTALWVGSSEVGCCPGIITLPALVEVTPGDQGIGMIPDWFLSHSRHLGLPGRQDTACLLVRTFVQNLSDVADSG